MERVKLSPWEMELGLHRRAKAYLERRQKTWRWLLSEGVRLVLERDGEGEPAPAMESVAVVPAAVSPAVVSPAVVSPAAAVPAAAVPAAVVPAKLSPTEESIALRRRRVALWRDSLPGHIAAGRLKVAATKEREIAEYKAEILELEAKLEAERAALSSESVGNVENAESLACQSEVEGEI